MAHIPETIDEAREIARDAMPALRMLQCGFENCMGYSKWDDVCEEGIYADDAYRAVSCFLEYVEDGRVTDDDGKEVA